MFFEASSVNGRLFVIGQSLSLLSLLVSECRTSLNAEGRSSPSFDCVGCLRARDSVVASRNALLFPLQSKAFF